MNLVFLDAKNELELASAFFPEEEFVLARMVLSEKELELAKQARSKNLSQKYCLVFSKADSKLLQKAKSAGFLAGIFGNSLSNSMAACQQKADFLLQPFGIEKPFFDRSILEIAAQNQVALGVFFSELLHLNPVEQSKWLKNFFLLARFCRKKKVALSVFSGARLFEECRAAKDLAAWLSVGQ